MKNLKEDETVIFGDISIRSQITPDGEKAVFIYADKGNIVVCPSSSNSIRVYSTLSKSKSK